MSALFSPVLLTFISAFRIATCLLVVAVQNPVHSLLLLIRVFLRGTLLLFSLQRDYFAILFLIVYVGAIVVLFLFVIRRLEVKRVSVARRLSDFFTPRAILLPLLVLTVLTLRGSRSFDLTPFLDLVAPSSPFFSALTEANVWIDWSTLLHRTDPLRALGGILYTEYPVTLLIAALLLTVSRVGAIVITLVVTTDHREAAALADRDSTSAIPAVPFTLAEHRTIKIQEAEHQARRYPAVFSVLTRTPTGAARSLFLSLETFPRDYFSRSFLL
jgi:NADH-quinone oxidoreductase subunit J